MRKVYVTAESKVSSERRSCVVTLYEDYNSAEDVGDGGTHAFIRLKAMFAEAIKELCTCRAEYENFAADKIDIIAVSPIHF